MVMANKLAGQKAKFVKARANFYGSDDEAVKARAIRLMAEVLAWANEVGVSEAEVTQGAEVPEEARRVSLSLGAGVDISDADADRYEKEVKTTIDISSVQELGSGSQCVYAYGYRRSPGLLKVGRSDGDVVTRIVNQINASTPGKPILELVIRTIRTNDCRSLEKTLHGVLQLRDRKEVGGGDEWFLTDVAELSEIYSFCVQQPSRARLAAV